MDVIKTGQLMIKISLLFSTIPTPCMQSGESGNKSHGYTIFSFNPFGYDASNWRESGCVRDMIILCNIFIRCAEPNILFKPGTTQECVNKFQQHGVPYYH